MLSHRNFIVGHAGMLGELVPVVRGDMLGMVLPLFHVNAQVVTTVMPMLIGAEVAMWERFSASTFWATVARFEPVTFSAVPTMLAALLHAPGADEAETNSVRYVVCGAAPLSPAMFAPLRGEVRHRVLEGYGLTEGTCCSTINPFTARARSARSACRCAGRSVVIRGDDGQAAGDGPGRDRASAART